MTDMEVCAACQRALAMAEAERNFFMVLGLIMLFFSFYEAWHASRQDLRHAEERLRLEAQVTRQRNE